MAAKKGRMCDTPYCGNRRAKDRRHCFKCISRKRRAANPMRASYDTLKYNARRRKKPFSITFAQFKEFCYETSYLAGKGRSAQSFSIDCEINELGYVYGNLRNRTVSENSRKGVKRLVYDWETGYATVVKH